MLQYRKFQFFDGNHRRTEHVTGGETEENGEESHVFPALLPGLSPKFSPAPVTRLLIYVIFTVE